MQATVSQAKIHQLLLDNNRLFTYTVRTIEIDNILSTSVLSLQEYAVMDMAGNTCMLYKTGGGNWYDMPEVKNPAADARLLALLKAGIDCKNRVAAG